jgi:hypothetical protein
LFTPVDVLDEVLMLLLDMKALLLENWLGGVSILTSFLLSFAKGINTLKFLRQCFMLLCVFSLLQTFLAGIVKPATCLPTEAVWEELCFCTRFDRHWGIIEPLWVYKANAKLPNLTVQDNIGPIRGGSIVFRNRLK